MATNSDQNRVEYSGDGSSAVFNFQYEFHKDTDLSVFVYNSSRAIKAVAQDFTTNYTISGDQDLQDRYLNGANVVFNSSPATGDEIVIFRSSAVTSLFTLPFTGAIPSAELVKALDRLTLLAQRLNDQTTRSLRLDDAYPFAINTKLPVMLPKSSPIIVNSTGLGFETGVVSNSGNVVTSHFGILPTSNGGLGIAHTPGIGDVLYADGPNSYQPLSAGGGGEVLMAKGAASPQFEKINLGSSETITGSLGFSQGGTGRTTIGADGEVMMAGTGAIVFEKINLQSSATITGTLPVASGGTALTETGDPGTHLVSAGSGTVSYQKINVGSSEQITGVLDYTNGGTGLSAAGGQDVPLIGKNGAAPAYEALNLASGSSVTGTLATGSGGTGQTTYAANELVFASSPTQLAGLGGAATGQTLTAQGSSAPVWATTSVTPTATVEKSAAYSATISDKTITISGSSDFAISLFDAVGNSGTEIDFIKSTPGNGLVSIVGSGAQTVNGTSALVVLQYETLKIVSDGANWLKKSHDIPTVKVMAKKSGTAISGTSTPITYSGEDLDSHGTWNGSQFTCPRPGIYSFRVSGYLNAGNTTMQLYAGGSLIKGISNFNNTAVKEGGGKLQLAKGNVIDYRTAIDATVADDGTNNQITIESQFGMGDNFWFGDSE